MVNLRRLKPLVAGLLGLTVTGLGHIYLRRWRRAAAWLLLVIVVGQVFVSPETLDFVNASFAQGGLFAPPQTPIPSAVLEELLLLSVVATASAVDAYLVGVRSLRDAEAEAGTGTSAADAVGATAADSTADATVNCPNCGKEFEAGMEFCPWCAERVAVADDEN
ncbi:zinc ribbon domain-containing protein [Haloprofundus salilacus]|uniref:zinc ribbon domain-containing protein n=1 Tax=Haloprofundus salilacus TaxID=2876190 RepID=UPI001CCF44B4|nr:zinc ribbon domain-containing protein [Haloprofundus salilacus]